jgi:hypothetical protein
LRAHYGRAAAGRHDHALALVDHVDVGDVGVQADQHIHRGDEAIRQSLERVAAHDNVGAVAVIAGYKRARQQQELVRVDQVAAPDHGVSAPQGGNGRATAVGDLAQGVAADHGHGHIARIGCRSGSRAREGRDQHGNENE